MVPFVTVSAPDFADDDYIFVPNIREALEGNMVNIPAYVLGETIKPLTLAIAPLTKEEKDIIRACSLINYNRMLKK